MKTAWGVAAALATAGDLNVTGDLNIGTQGLPALSRIGSFKAGSLSATNSVVVMNSKPKKAPAPAPVPIGSKTIKGSSIGSIVIGSIPKSSREFLFAFSQYTGSPNAIIGGKGATAKAGTGTLVNGARLILTPGLTSAQAKTPTVKSTAKSK